MIMKTKKTISEKVGIAMLTIGILLMIGTGSDDATTGDILIQGIIGIVLIISGGRLAKFI